MGKIEINREFIDKWESQYDKENVGDDEDDYEVIKEKVKAEISDTKTISKDTFISIMDWKAARAKGRVNWTRFDLYQDAIRLIDGVPDALKPGLLVWLDGIDIPVASTILHFLYPDRFPIADYRVIDALNEAELLTSYTISKKTYRTYKAKIEGIVKDTGCSIREIDRALFAYQKVNE